jgi:hypothetical protein
VAHASFQDRVILALNPPAEPEGGVAPLTGTFVRPPMKSGGPPKAPPAPEGVGTADATPVWLQLQQELDRQRARPGRIRVPSREEVLARLGEDHPGARQAGIVWSRVAYGYQPELTQTWFDCGNAFREEAGFTPVFANAIFWVVTRSLNCFY